MDNFGRGERFYMEKPFVPDCINMDIILFRDFNSDKNDIYR